MPNNPESYDEKTAAEVDTSVSANNAVDYAVLRGKSVVITGGASGIGEAMARGFVKAGAFVTIADIQEELGNGLVKELGGSSQFVKCDVTSWEEQVAMFKAAVSNSPQKSCDIVFANAGVGEQDSLSTFDETDEPVKPDMRVLDINQTGVIYTTKLAFHYFNKQPETEDRERCLVLTASIAGFLDLPVQVQYNMSKFSLRGLMRSLRRTSGANGIRVNIIAPWFIGTPIMPEGVRETLQASGLDFALVEDAAAAALRIAADKTVHGRSLGIVPRKISETGYMDLKQDDHEEGTLWGYFQHEVLTFPKRLGA
ncbi:hypothetical protein FQN54_009397 [Arachnomyces sp. PD_36]|nr:hypothetical protein FQN54_009397 [Arachnomyces sp. PD_36]